MSRMSITLPAAPRRRRARENATSTVTPGEAATRQRRSTTRLSPGPRAGRYQAAGRGGREGELARSLVVVHQRARARGPAHGPIQKPAEDVSAGRGQGPSHAASPVQQAARFGQEALARPERHHDDPASASDPVLQVAGDGHSLPDSGG